MYAAYKEKSVINPVNSINGVKFDLVKSETTRVSGREWYFKYNGNIYFLSEKKSYSIEKILEKIGATDSGTTGIDLYANWNDKKISSGTDIPTTFVNIKYHINKGKLGDISYNEKTKKFAFYVDNVGTEAKDSYQYTDCIFESEMEIS